MRAASAVLAILLVLLPARPATPEEPSAATPLSGEEIRLWPGDAPGSEGLALEETLTERSRDPDRHDRAITHVLRPSLSVHRPAAPNGAAVIVAPGGGYQRVVIDKEGGNVAEWLNGLGVTAFVLKYRLPEEGHAAPADVPLQDAQRAMRVLRSRAESLGIDPRRIGILGFSAGGHLAGSLAAYPDASVYAPADAAEAQSARPDFAVLVYPAVGTDFVASDVLERYPGLRQVVSKYPLEPGVSKEWPPTFLLQTADDPSVAAEGALRLFRALRTAGVPAEIHVFQAGGHGFGIRNAKGPRDRGGAQAPVARWPALCGEWMRSLGVLDGP